MNEQPKKSFIKRFWLIIIFVSIIIAGLAYYFIWYKTNNMAKTTENITNGEKLVISEEVLNNKFGWLGGGADDTGDGIIENGGAWVRPHPGAFVWDMMQKSNNGEINFSNADEMVSNYQKNNLGILATIWPFADWDQKNLANALDCKVADNDEFLPKNDKKDRGSYLPQYRCNPSDWESYQKFVQAIVERYDGDGVSDMPGLKIPVKYWEVMNEPDLQYKSNKPMINETSSLNFYKLGPTEYGELLKKTYSAIKQSDVESKVLIAGAAGADQFLDFYSTLFTSMSDASNYFDIGNIHCISNDQQTHDFNVSAYKKMLENAGIITKPIWVTEAEAMNGNSAEENYQSTANSTSGAISAGAERIFFTRYTFDDFRKDMSDKTESGSYPSAEKYQAIIKQNNKN